MVNRGSSGMPARRTVLLLCLAFVSLLATSLAPSAAHAQGQTKRLLLYTGTTGFRHTDGINGGRPVVQSALEAAGYTVDWEDCTNNGGGCGQLRQREQEPAHLHGHEPRALRRDRPPERFFRASRPAVG